MLTPSKLFLFRVGLPEQYMDSFLFELLKNGSVQFENFDSVNNEQLQLGNYRVPENLKYFKNAKEKLNSFKNIIQFSHTELNKTRLLTYDYTKDLPKINEIYDTYQELYNQLNAYSMQAQELEEKLRKLEKIKISPKIKNLSGSSFLWYKMGYLSPVELESLKQKLQNSSILLSVAEENADKILISLIGLKKDQPFIEALLKGYNWQDWDITKELGSEYDISRMKQLLAEAQKKMVLIKNEINKVIEENQNFLKMIYAEIEALVLLNEVKSYFKHSKNFVFVAFWSPVKNKDQILEIIKQTSQNQCYVEGIEAWNLQKILKNKIAIPVLYDNLSIFTPFKDLVSGYSLPAYGTIDPTPIFALTFIAMYGVMFSDIGHGFVLLLFGLFLLFSKKQKNKNFSIVISLAGVSSMIFGWLFGSFFGYEDIIPALWLKPMEHIPFILLISVIFGLFFLTMSIIFNLINSIRMKDPTRGIFDKFGLAGGIFFWGILSAVIYAVTTKSKINFMLLKIVIFSSIGLFLLKGPILWLLKKQKKPFEDGLMTYLLESGIEILDLFTGYLSNSMSYLRLGAFALAHAGLLVAVFSVMNIVRSSHFGNLLSGIVFVLGNIGVIILEGLIVWIQSLRLEYYEFFTKFFREGKRQFTPLSFE